MCREHDPKWKDEDEGALEPTWVDSESELEDEIMEVLDDIADDDDADGWRVYVYDPVSKPLGSKQGAFIAADEETEAKPGKGAEGFALSHMGSALSTLAGECTRMMKENRLAFGVVCTALAQREDVTAKALLAFTDAKIDAVRAESDALEAVTTAQQAVETAIAAQPDDEPNTAADRALDMFERFFGARFGPPSPAPSSSNGSNGDGGDGLDDIDWDAVADRVVENPDLEAKAGAAFMGAQQRKRARAAADAKPKIDPAHKPKTKRARRTKGDAPAEATP